MKNTLVIHPSDSTTDFLKPIYEGIDVTLITGGVTQTELIEMINGHSRIMLMGHGAANGLFSVGQFPGSDSLIIDRTFIECLEKKKDKMFIWCHADAFVGRWNLDGFYTGMFISEVYEADDCGISNVTKEMVEESNTLFSKVIKGCVNKDIKSIFHEVKEHYGTIVETNPVAAYNHYRLCAKTGNRIIGERPDIFDVLNRVRIKV